MKKKFQIKGGLFTLSVLQLHSIDFILLNEVLEAKKNINPNYFKLAIPIVIDVKNLNIENIYNLNFKKLKEVLFLYKIYPVGFKGISERYIQKYIQNHGYPILNSNQYFSLEKKKYYQKNSLIITDPVRSGQQIYAKNRDLIITNNVSPGSELFSDGHIHVYGTLKGRALAGINGNTSARIFCNKLEAELVSISGHYKIFENSHNFRTIKLIQFYLKNGKLIMSSLK